MDIRVLGSGCSKHHSTISMIERAALAAGVTAEITRAENPDDLLAYEVQATPAVVIDGRLVHSGGLPSHEQVLGWLSPISIGFLKHPTRYLFFTGKGGVGKTSLSTAAAMTLADAGQKVLLVSTDAASNLDELLGVELRNTPTPVPVPSAPILWAVNIDPDNAAESYRQRVLAQMGATDTSPTGHALRRLSQPRALRGFFAGNARGASCLGRHPGLKTHEFAALADRVADRFPELSKLVSAAAPPAGEGELP